MKKTKLSEILTPSVITVALDVAIAEVLSLMSSLNISCVVAVNSERQPLGIFTEQDAVRLLAGQQPPGTLRMADAMAIPPLCCTPDVGYLDAFRMLQEHGFRHLIVVDEHNCLLGIVTEEDFLRQLGAEEFLEFKTVAKVMSRNIATVNENETVAAAARQMRKHHLSCVIEIGRAHV